jgi:hypothetical protein
MRPVARPIATRVRFGITASAITNAATAAASPGLAEVSIRTARSRREACTFERHWVGDIHGRSLGRIDSLGSVDMAPRQAIRRRTSAL